MPKRLSSFASICFGLAAVLWGASAGTSDAYVLDWNSVNWTPTWGTNTSVNQMFTNVDGSGFNVKITVSRSSVTTSTEVQSTNSLPNDVSSQFTGRGGQEALLVDVDWNLGNNNGNTDYIQFDIEFFKYVAGGNANSQDDTRAAVSLVNFELWDIDLGNTSNSRYQDIIREFKSYRNNVLLPNVKPTFSNAPGGNGSDWEEINGELHGVATLGSTTNAGNENDGSRTGDVVFSYNGFPSANNAAIDKISFQYQPGNGASAGINLNAPGSSVGVPSLQRIALGDINFAIVPEVFSARGALFVCAAVIAAPWFGRRRRIEAAA